MRKVSHLTGKRRTILSVMAWITCFVVVSKLLSSFITVAEPFDKAVAYVGGESVFIHTSGSTPLFPVPIPEEPNIPDEVEPKDECDDELTRLLTGLFTQSCEALHSKNLLFLHLKGSVENRSSVSLIVLHHSWKSFIS